MGVVPIDVPGSCVISPSYELKTMGAKTAMRIRDVKLMAPNVILKQANPPLYQEIHRQLCRIFRDYSPDVLPKSIDEAVIYLHGSPALKVKTMEQIGLELKERLYREIGCWMSVNVGIGCNAWQAKTAAGLHKPDGLDCIDATNLRGVLSSLRLTDLCGIANGYEARLNQCGIFTPLEFLDAEADYLHRQVFGSVVGRYWCLMLHGYEHQSYLGPERKSYNNSHSIRVQSADPEPNLSILCSLCEEAGRRMRRDMYSCRTIAVYLFYADGTYFKDMHTARTFLYTTKELFTRATLMFNRQKEFKQIHKIAVHLYNLGEGAHEQLNLFDDDHGKQRKAMDAAYRINLKHGRNAIYIAPIHYSLGRIYDSISFCSTGDVHQLMEEMDAIELFDDMEEDVFFEDGFPMAAIKDIPIRSKNDMGRVGI